MATENTAASVPNPLIASNWPGGWAIVKRSFVDFFTNIVPFLVGLLILIPIFIVLGLIIAAQHNTALLIVAGVLGIVGVIGVVYVGVCVSAATPLYALARADGHKMTVREMYKFRFKLFIKLLVASIVLFIPVIIGLILLIIPGIIALIYLVPTMALTPFVIAEQGKGPIEGIKIAHAMGKPHRGKVWGIVGFYFLIYLIILIPLVILVMMLTSMAHAYDPQATSGNDTSSSNSGGGSGLGGGDPISSIAFAYLYRWIQAQPQAATEAAAQPPAA